MSRVDELELGRWECWICGKIVYDPVEPSKTHIHMEEQLSLCNRCMKEFTPTARNQRYCTECRAIKLKHTKDFSRLASLKRETLRSLGKILEPEEVILLAAQEPDPIHAEE